MNKAKKERLRTVAERVLACPCVWDEDPRPFMPPTTKKLATLSVNSVIHEGFDDRRTNYVPSTKKIQNNLTGLRTYVVSVRLETLTEGDAADDLSVLYFGLWERSVQFDLHIDGLAIQQVTKVVKVPSGRVDGRILSTAIADIRLTSAESYRVADEEIIESAEISPDVLEP